MSRLEQDFVRRASGSALTVSHVIWSVVGALAADPAGSVGVDGLRERLQQDAIAFGAVFRASGRVEVEKDPADDGPFDIQAARLRIWGGFDGGVGYNLQTEVEDGRPRVIDLWGEWEAPGGQVGLRIGRQKVGFSEEFLLPIQAIDMTNRARAVTLLAPQRDLGVELHGRLKSFEYQVGVFDEGWFTRAEDEHPLIASRFGVVGTLGAHELGVHLAGSWSSDRGAFWLGRDFDGWRTMAGLDLSWRHGPVRVSAEVLAAYYEPLVARNEYPCGGHVTVAYRVSHWVEVLARVEGFSRSQLAGLDNAWVTGVNLTPVRSDGPPPVTWQINYRAPLHRRRGGDHELQVVGQLWF